MLDLPRLQAIRLRPRPLFQRFIGAFFLAPNYNWPFARTRITLEGLEHFPRGGGAILVMNHTDRYNYWPLQYKLWRLGLGFTATWVKGKYYEHPLLARFMDAGNNIPMPSKGYVLSKDFAALHGRLPSDAEYGALRRLMDGQLDEAAAAAQAPAVGALLTAPRGETPTGRYRDSVEARLSAMMARVVELNLDALKMGLYLLIFPEGTRSRRLGQGRSGAAQIALRSGAPVVPIGCNGSDLCYPGNSPWSRGGAITYRIGRPLTPDGELRPFLEEVRAQGPFQPFTAAADAQQPLLQRLTELLMDRINALLDPAYQHDPDAPLPRGEAGARRFL